MANRPATASKATGDVPRYKILEKCYLDDRLLDPELQPFDNSVEPDPDTGFVPRRPLIVPFAGIPAYYMEPVNEAARAMVAKYKPEHVDPIRDLQITTGKGVDIKKQAEEIQGNTTG